MSERWLSRRPWRAKGRLLGPALYLMAGAAAVASMVAARAILGPALTTPPLSSAPPLAAVAADMAAAPHVPQPTARPAVSQPTQAEVAPAEEEQPAIEEEQPAIKEYVVRQGDTLNIIAEKFGISAEALLWSNDLSEPEHLPAGERLLVPTVPGVVHRVRPGETVNAVAAMYGVDAAKIIAINGLAAPFLLKVDQRLLIPGVSRPEPTPQPAPTAAPPAPPETVAEPKPEGEVAAAAVEVKPAPEPQPQPSSPQEAFILSIAAGAQASQKSTGIPASVTMAQAILESFWGSSRLAKEAKNYFGIKAHSKPGSAGVYWMDAWEVIGGRNVVRREPFRAYASVADSFTDHAQFLVENSRYAPALAAKDDPRQFARELGRAGYATDPAYASKLISLMDQYNLYRFNE